MDLGFVSWGQWIESDNYRFKISKGPGFDLENDRIFTGHSVLGRTIMFRNGYQKILLCELTRGDKSSLLSIDMKGNNRQKIADYLNASIAELQAYELRQKKSNGSKYY